MQSPTLWDAPAEVPPAQKSLPKNQEEIRGISFVPRRFCICADVTLKSALEKRRSGQLRASATGSRRPISWTAFARSSSRTRKATKNQNFADTFVLQVIKGEHETIWPEKFAAKNMSYPIPAGERESEDYPPASPLAQGGIYADDA